MLQNSWHFCCLLLFTAVQTPILDCKNETENQLENFGLNSLTILVFIPLSLILKNVRGLFPAKMADVNIKRKLTSV